MEVLASNVVVFSVSMGLLLVCNLLSFPMFLLRSHLEPIRSRHPDLVLFACVWNYLSTVEPFLRRVLGIQHCVSENLNNFIVGYMFQCYIIRAWILWHHFEVLFEMVKFQQKPSMRALRISTNELIKQDFWFLQRKHWIEPRFYWKVLVCSAVLWFLPPLLIFLASPSCNSRTYVISNLVAIIMYLAQAFVLVFLAVKLRKQYDFFWIKTELKIIAFIAAFSLLIWAATLIFASKFNNQVFSVSSFIFFLLSISGNFFALSVPVYLSYQNLSELNSIKATATTATSRLEHKRKIHDLNELFDGYEGGLKALEEFMIGELSVENLLCLKSAKQLVLQLYRLENGEEIDSTILKSELDDFFDTFIKTDSKLEVNISARLKESFEKVRLAEGKPCAYLDPLENLDKELSHLVMGDTWTRFVRSSVFKRFEYTVQTSVSF